MDQNTRNIIPIFVTVFIDLVGLGIVIPVLAPLFLSPTSSVFSAGTSMATRNLMLGLLIASYPIAQFFGAPILGAWSDRIGRKKIFLLSLAGTFVGYLIFGFGILQGSLPLLFLSRMVDGFTGGNLSVAQSAIADLSDQKTKAKNFGLIGMAFGLGFVLGPYIGGKLADPTFVSWFNFSTPFFFAALLCASNITLVVLMFRETLKTSLESEVSVFSGFKNLKKALGMKGLRNVFGVVFLFNFGFTFFTQFFPVFLIEKFHFTQGNIGDFFAYLGIWVAITQGLIVRPLAKKYPPQKILVISILLLALAFPPFLLPSSSIWLYAIVPFMAIFNGLTQPNVNALVSNMAGRESQGEILGINQSIRSVAQSLPAIISGVIVSINSSFPTIVAAISMFAAWIVFIAIYKSSNHEMFHQA